MADPTAPTVSTDGICDEAVAYAKAGLDLFPASPADKRPLVSQHQATTDLGQISRWWQRWPEALIGHRLPAGQIILDVDPRHGGLEVWEALAELGPIPSTLVHYSGRDDGGCHLWWRRPAVDLSVKGLDRWAEERGLGANLNPRWTAGIDLLTREHRYTILPPSPHPETGRPYIWGVEAPAVSTMPQFLVDLLTRQDRPKSPPPPPRDEDSVADWFTERTTWADVLGPHGWSVVGSDGEADGSEWRHPEATTDHSATISHGCLFVYSTSTAFEPTVPGEAHGYTRFRAWATLEHGGDLRAAARAAHDLRGDRHDGWQAFEDLTGRRNGHRADDHPADDDRDHQEPGEAGRHSATNRIAEAMLTSAQLAELPAPEPLIAGILNRDSLALLYGSSGAGKSFVAIDWALSVATGGRWTTHPVTAGPVVYVAAEGVTGVARRVDAWRKHRQVYDLDGGHPVRWLPMAVNLTDPVETAALIAAVETISPALVVIDTLARCAAGADENSAKDMGVLVANADALRRQTGACVLAVHHAGKDSSQGARGSSALRAAVDSEIEAKGAEGRVLLRVTKQKDGAEPSPLHLRHHHVAGSLVLVPAQPGDEDSDELTPAALTTLEALRAIEVPGGVAATAWMEAAETPKSTFHRHRHQLLVAGMVHNVGTDRAPRYLTPSEQDK